MPQRNGRQQRQHNGRSVGSKDDQGREVLPGPKKPVWCCACGEGNNWASRIKCKGCNRNAPQSVVNRAKAAAKQRAASDSGPRAPPCPTQSSRPTKEHLEYEALKKECEALKKTLKSQATLQPTAGGGEVGGAEEASDDAAMDSAAEDLAARIKAQRARVSKMEHADQDLKDVWGKMQWAVKMETEKAALADVQQRSREAKPLDVQLKSALQHRNRCERHKEHTAEAVERTMREQAALEAKLVAFRKAAGEAAANLASAEADYKRLQDLQAQPARAPAVPPLVHDAPAGHVPAGPIAVSVEDANQVQAVLDGMCASGKIPPQLVDAFVFAENTTFIKPPGALPPASGGHAVHAAVNEDEAAAAARTAEPAAAAARFQQRKANEAAAKEAEPAGKGNGRGDGSAPY